MDTPLAAYVQSVVARAPLWLRQELASRDPATRARAEETLAAMIADALDKDRAG